MNRLPSRLYLSRSKDRAPNWVIRDGTRTIRTGALEHEADKARDALHLHMIGTGELGGLRSDISYRRTRNTEPSTIYFLTCDAPDFPIKIGIASNVERRIKGLQNALPFDVILLAQMPGSLTAENHLHCRFAHLRLRGEWFRRSHELMNVIAQHAPLSPGSAAPAGALGRWLAGHSDSPTMRASGTSLSAAARGGRG